MFTSRSSMRAVLRAQLGTDIIEAPGFTRVPSVVDGREAFDIVAGPLGRGLLRAVQKYWRACADEGIDQVVEDVWLTKDQALGFRSLMAGLDVVWVGVHCPTEVIEQRERDRGGLSLRRDGSSGEPIGPRPGSRVPTEL